jgi:acyl-CoA reductase-like NAD-dependent aldehyde dehydrogenase
MTAAARRLTPVTLELGGKCPCIVAADAPLEVTARRIVWGKFMNAGQTCVAPDHVLVDQRVSGALVAAIKQALRDFYGEDPQQSPDYGRIINRRHFDRLVRYLGDGRVAHGGRHDAGDRYLEPTVLTGVAQDAPVMREEIFGPVLPVLEFSEIGDVLAKLRERPTPLALYLFSADHALQERVLAGSRSGGVCLNDTITHILCKDLPFGGLGESGMGAYHGRASFDCFTHFRSVLRRSLAPDPLVRYPPPRVALKGLKRILRIFGAG